jgi:hypothetical protein
MGTLFSQSSVVWFSRCTSMDGLKGIPLIFMGVSRMTIASMTAAQDRARSVEMFDLLAATADRDGKFQMAALYRCAADGHRARMESTQQNSKPVVS